MKALYKLGTALFVLLSLSVQAGVEKGVEGYFGTDIPSENGTLIIQDLYYSQYMSGMDMSNQFVTRGKTARAVLKYDQTELVHYTEGWKIEVGYDATVTYENGTTAIFSDQHLEIAYSPTEGYRDVHVRTYDGAIALEMTNISSDICGVNLSAMPKDVHLDAEIYIERCYKLNSIESPYLAYEEYLDTKELKLGWEFFEGAEYYQLEWLFVEIGDYDFTDTEVGVLPVDFNNATRIHVSDNHYEIPLTFPKGFLMYRVRAVGLPVFAESCDDNVIYGNWSNEGNDQSTVSDFTNLNTGHYIKYDGLDLDKNWQYSSSYAENGLRKDVITYHDGSLRARQVVSNLSTDPFTILGESVYDAEGRASVNMLPNIVENKGLVFHETDFSGFDYTDFDLDGNYENAGGVNSTASVNQYYSASNTLDVLGKDYIPDANNYPYTMTSVTNDGANRSVKSAMAGDKLRMGAGHEAVNSYSKPGSQLEIDRLFGAEAAPFDSYEKVISTDQNGVISVAYIDAGGKTVATGLMGESTQDIGALENIDHDDYNDEQDGIYTGSISDFVQVNNYRINNVLYSNYQNYTSGNGLKYDYTLESIASFDFDLEGCEDYSGGTVQPVYDLLLEVKDEFGNILYTVPEDEVSPGYSTEIDFSTIPALSGVTGAISVEKSLQLSNKSFDDIRTKAETCVDYADFYQAPEPCSCLDKEFNELLDEGYYLDYKRNPSLNLYYVQGTTAYLLDADGNKFDATGASLNEVELNPVLIPVIVDANGTELLELDYTASNFDSDPTVHNYLFDDLTANQWTLLKLVCADNSYEPNYTGCEEELAYDFMPGGQFAQKKEINLIGYDEMYPARYLDGISSAPSGLTEATNINLDYLFEDGSAVESDITAFIGSWDEFYKRWNDSYVTKAGSVISIWQFIEYNTNPVSPEKYLYDELLPSHPEDGITYCGSNYDFRFELVNMGTDELTPIVNPDIFSPTVLEDFIHQDNALGTNETAVQDAFEELFDAIHNGLPASPPTGLSDVLKELNGDGTGPGLLANAYSLEEFFRKLYLSVRDNLINTTWNGSTSVYTVFDGLYKHFEYPVPYDEDWVNNLWSSGAIDYTELHLELQKISDDHCRQTVQEKVISWMNDLYGDPDNVFNVYTKATPSLTWNTTTYNIIDWNTLPANFPVECEEYVELNSFDNTILSQLTATEKAKMAEEGTAFWLSIDGGAEQLAVLKHPTKSVFNDFLEKKLMIALQTDISDDCDCGGVINPSTGTIDDWLRNLLDDYFTDLNLDGDFNTTDDVFKMVYDDDATGEILEFVTGSQNETNYCLNDKQYFEVQLPNTTDWWNTLKLDDLTFENALVSNPYTVTESDGDGYSICLNNLSIRDESVNIAYQKELNKIVEKALLAMGQFALAKGTVQEKLEVTYPLREYHYTLFYYDRAGNLLKTVPPKGVNVLTDTTDFDNIDAYREDPATGSAILPNHTFKTDYAYNSLQQLEDQNTPDGGITDFWYDEKGRIILSQNARQGAVIDGKERYTYTFYDDLGRIVQVGQCYSSLEPTPANLITTIDTNPFKVWVEAKVRDEIIVTVYDIPGKPNKIDNDPEDIGLLSGQLMSAAFGQNHLRNRVSYTTSTTSKLEAGVSLKRVLPDHTVYFDYDVHGNVKHMLVRFRDMHNQYWYKQIDYDYDLISGNVKELAYQQGEYDQFYIRYFYDADNRLLDVENSKDNIIWDRDAKYKYYAHGPLARIEYGDRHVQAQDFVYNINGWIKTVNASTLDPDRDMGEDGKIAATNLHRLIARDAFGFSLHYHDGDYSPIGTAANDVLADVSNTAPAFVSDGKDLFNGNIAKMITAISNGNQDASGIEELPTMISSYRYDLLNRIKSMASTEVDEANNGVIWPAELADYDYNTSYAYDPNGNLMSLARKSETEDYGLIYSYETDKNRLSGVTGGPWGNGTYTYDESGNLKTDGTDDTKITNIDRTIGGKVRSIERESDSEWNNLDFVYDATGHRYAKIDKPKQLTAEEFYNIKSTYYVRDASGNILATYKQTKEQVAETTPLDDATGVDWREMVYTKLEERNLYGSKRLGVDVSNDKVDAYELDVEANYGGGAELTYEPSLSSGTELALYFPGENGWENFESWIIADDFVNYGYTHRDLGQKQFELSSHLGNVMSVVSDRKISKGVNYGGDNTVLTCVMPSTQTGLVWDVNSSATNGYVPTTAASTEYLSITTPAMITTVVDAVPYTPASETLMRLGGNSALSTSIWRSGGTVVVPVHIGDKIDFSCFIDYERWKPGFYVAIELNGAVILEDTLQLGASIGNYTGNLNREWTEYLEIDGVEQYCDQLVLKLTPFVDMLQYQEDASHFCHFDNITVEVERNAELSSGDLSHYLADIRSYSDYYPFGMQMEGRKLNEGDYRFGYQGSEKDDEFNGTGNSYTTYFRQLAPRLGRWLSIDPKSTATESPYVSMGNRPIYFNDVLGDTVMGISPSSSFRLVEGIKGSFPGSEASKLRNLFKLDSDGLTISSIDKNDFVNAVSGLSEDEQQLAYGYYGVINSQDIYEVEIVKRGESLSADGNTVLGTTNGTGADLDTKAGGGANKTLPSGSNYSVLLLNSSSGSVPFMHSKGLALGSSSVGELLAHELLGHGVGDLLGSSGRRHKDALQLTNLYRRVQGSSFWRNGFWHGNKTVIGKSTANSVPVYLKIPASMQLKINEKNFGRWKNYPAKQDNMLRINRSLF